jgi:serine phosphatase RsbU (regulator of sigma subunit)
MSEDKDKYANLQLRELFIRQMDKMDALEARIQEIDAKQREFEQSFEVRTQVEQALLKIEEDKKKKQNAQTASYIAIGTFLMTGLFKVIELIYHAITNKP